MPIGVKIVSLLQLLNTILVEYPVKKDQINLVIYFSIPFFFRIHRSLLYNIQLKAPLILRLSIDTIYSKRACHAAQTLKVIKNRTKRVDYFFFTPICVYSRSLYTFMASYMRSATIFSNIFSSVFLRATSWQLPNSKQSFLFTFQSITIIVFFYSNLVSYF